MEEARRSAEVLGVDQPLFLGFNDSGSHDGPHHASASGRLVDLMEDAWRSLVSSLHDLRADSLVGYDAMGTTSTPTISPFTVSHGPLPMR
jgi:LmbE family N-acetylglucosaminyl deacetylase